MILIAIIIDIETIQNYNNYVSNSENNSNVEVVNKVVCKSARKTSDTQKALINK